MSKKLHTVKEVKYATNVDNFHHINREQIISFVTAIPNMSKEVAMKCIEQFPNFKEFANISLGQFNSLCEKAIENDPGQMEIIECYKKTIQNFSDIIKRDDISETERHYYTELIIDSLNKVTSILDKNMEHKKRIVRMNGGLIAFGIMVGGAILGIKTGSFKLPKK